MRPRRLVGAAEAIKTVSLIYELAPLATKALYGVYKNPEVISEATTKLSTYAASKVRSISTFFGKRERSIVGVENAMLKTQINPAELQVTHEMIMSKKASRRLVNDIKENGIKEPIKYVEREGKTYVVDGHHRLAAARQLNLKEVPVEKTNLPYAGYRTVEDLNYYGY